MAGPFLPRERKEVPPDRKGGGNCDVKLFISKKHEINGQIQVFMLEKAGTLTDCSEASPTLSYSMMAL